MDRLPEYSYEFGPFRVDTVRRLLLCQGQPIPIRPKAFEVLVALVDSPGFISKSQLMERVWSNRFVEEANIHHNICMLRKALGEAGRCIQTASGDGYRFVAEVRRVANCERSPDEVEGFDYGNGQPETALRALLEMLGVEQNGRTESERVATATVKIRVRPGSLTLEIKIPGLPTMEPATEGPERKDDQTDANSPGSRARRRSATAG